MKKKAAYVHVYVYVYVYVYVHVFVIVYGYVYDTLLWSDNKQNKPFTLYNQANRSASTSRLNQHKKPNKHIYAYDTRHIHTYL